MNKTTGVTLLEFIAATAIMATVSITVIPGLRGLVQNNRLITQTNDIVSAVQLARSEAIKRRGAVILCKSDQTPGDCDSSARWRDGWILFADSNADNKRNGSEPLIRVYPALSDGLTLGSNRPLRNSIKFNAKGYSNGYNGRLILCDQRGNAHARVLILSSTGRLRLTSHAGQPEGSTVNCPD